jgi:hypothetical protein
MATSELKAVAPQTIHRFFELMVPNLTSFVIFLCLLTAAKRACGSDGTRECVVEDGIGGDSEHFGDIDAHLGRIYVFYHEASGGKYVPRAVVARLALLSGKPREPHAWAVLGQRPLQNG